MTITPEMAEVIEKAIESQLIDLHTSLPVKVTKYDSVTQTVELEIQLLRMLEKADGTIATEALPKLQSIRVGFLRSGGMSLTFPVSVGDTGRAVFFEMSVDQWLSKNTVTTPADVGRHGLGACVYIPDYVANANVSTEALVGTDLILGKDGGAQLRVKPGGTVEVVSSGGPTASDFVAMAALVDSFISKFDTVMRTWVPVANDGGAALKGQYLSPIGGFPSPPPATASTNLKAD